MDLASSGSSSNLMPGRGLLNPAFVIKIVPATDDMQQRASSGRNNQADDYLANYKIGDEVSVKLSKKTINCRIERIIKNSEGDGIYAIVKDSTGKKHKVESSRIIPRINNNPNTKSDLESTPAMFAESKFLSFKDFSIL